MTSSGSALQLGGAVLDRQAFDGLELDLAALHLGREDVLEDAHGLAGDGRADAVTAADADADVGRRLVVEPVRLVLEPLDTRELLLDQSREMVSGAVEDGLVYHGVSSLSH